MQASEVAKVVVESKFFPLMERKFGQLYIYRPLYATWDQLKDSSLPQIVYQVLDDLWIDPPPPLKVVTKHVLDLIPITEDVEAYFAISIGGKLPLAGRKLLNLATREYTDRTEKDRFTFSLPVKWNPEASPVEVRKFLDDLLEEGEQKKLQLLLKKVLHGQDDDDEYLGRFRFCGPSACGITTLFTILETCFGPLTVHCLGTQPNFIARVELIAEKGRGSVDAQPPSIIQFIEQHQRPYPEGDHTITFKQSFIKGKQDPTIVARMTSEENRSALLNWILA